MVKISRRLIAVTGIIVLVALGLLVWTLGAPPILAVQSNDQLKNSVMSVARSSTYLNTSDSFGTCSVKFGLDYPDSSIQAGSQVEFKVYVALVSEQISSVFARGISLSIQEATLLIDGRDDTGVKVVMMTFQPSIDTVLFEFVNTALPSGTHNATARLLVSTVDEFYLGYSSGKTQVVVLNGVFSISG